MVRLLPAGEGWMVARAGSACRLDNCPPAVVECGLCPIRRMCPRLMRWRGCVRGSRSWRDSTRGCAQAAAARDELAAAQLAARDAQIAALAALVEDLRRRAG